MSCGKAFWLDAVDLLKNAHWEVKDRVQHQGGTRDSARCVMTAAVVVGSVPSLLRVCCSAPRGIAALGSSCFSGGWSHVSLARLLD